MASFWEKLGVTGLGALEGVGKGGLIAAAIGGAICGLPVVGLGLWAASSLWAYSGFLGISAGLLGVGFGAWTGVMGAIGLAPFGAALGAPIQGVQRLKQHNVDDLAMHQNRVIDGQMKVQQAAHRLQQAQAGYAAGSVSRDMAPQTAPGGRSSYVFDNETARSGHAASVEQQRLEQYANLGAPAKGA